MSTLNKNTLNTSAAIETAGHTLIDRFRVMKSAEAREAAAAPGGSTKEQDAYFTAMTEFYDAVVISNHGLLSVELAVHGRPPEVRFYDPTLPAQLDEMLKSLAESTGVPADLTPKLSSPSMAGKYTNGAGNGYANGRVPTATNGEAAFNSFKLYSER